MNKILNQLKRRNPSLMGLEQLPKYSILLPLVEVENETHILFEVRSLKLRRQPGQICFPGGKIDENDRDQQHCAIRETCEELGIEEENIEDVLPLDTMISPHNHILFLFVGKITDINLIKPNEAEVGEVFTVPLSYFKKTIPDKYRIYFRAEPEEGFPYELIGGKDYQWADRHVDQYFYQYNEKVIWGITGRILTYFLELLKSE
jgi:peroxisomal coenzyme A diphosphatase NUDT7